MYNIGDIYRVDFLAGYYTYVILSYDNHLAEVRYKSLLAGEQEPSISLGVLKRADHKFICKKTDAQYEKLINEMKENKGTHLDLWKKWDAQGHYNADSFLKENASLQN